MGEGFQVQRKSVKMSPKIRISHSGFVWKEISVSRDRLMDTERINNRWSLEETDAMIAPLNGTMDDGYIYGLCSPV